MFSAKTFAALTFAALASFVAASPAIMARAPGLVSCDFTVTPKPEPETALLQPSVNYGMSLHKYPPRSRIQHLIFPLSPAIGRQIGGEWSGIGFIVRPSPLILRGLSADSFLRLGRLLPHYCQQ